MTDPAVQIKSIQEKLQQLLRKLVLLQKENQRLKKELENAQAVSEEKEHVIQAMQQQLDVLKMGAGNLSEAERNTLNRRIDGYLKEIDKCLALLNT